jgi:putative heme-binding domain-containing protein
MSKKRTVIALLMGAILTPLENASAQTPAQAERGRKVFQERNCTNCHRFENQGTPVAPDLNNIARISPKAIAIAIRSTRTQNVISVKLQAGEAFPAIRASADDKTLQVYDLGKDPPVMRKLEKAQVESIKDNESWRHPPSSTGLTTEQLADVIAYIRWIAVRDKKGVDPSEVE